jgi:hypothetical protein
MRVYALATLMVAAAPAIGSAQTVQWFVQFGGPAQDRAFAIAVNASGLYVAGATEGALPGQRNAGGIDAFVRKCNLNGVEVWTRQFGTPGIDEVLAIALDATGIYVAGDTQGALSSAAPAGPHAFIRKYDLNGVAIWTREFGSGRREEVLAVAAAAGGVYAAGDTTVAAPPFDDGFVAAFDAKGGPRWSWAIGTGSEDRASAIAVHASGVYVAGATQGALPGQASVGDSDNFLRKYDLDGNELWTRQFGTPESDEIVSMALSDTGLYLAGTTTGTTTGQPAGGAIDAVVAKYDFNGQPVWTRQFGTSGYDDALGIAVSAQGVYVAGNTTGTLPGQVNAGDYDALVRKYDLGGRVLWTKQFGSAAHDEVLGVAADASGVYAVGVTEGALPGQRSKGSSDAFIVKLGDGPARQDQLQQR